MRDYIRKLLFIVPPVSPGNGAISRNLASYNEIPFGVLSLATYINKYCSKTVNINILDFNVSNDLAFVDKIKKTMEQFKPDIVGISGLFNSMFSYVNEFSRYVKEINPSLALVVGGAIATNCYELLFRHNPYIDGACYAEGEIPMRLLVDAENPFSLLEGHPSWITRKKISSGVTPSPTFIQDLDEIPPINYAMVDLEKYDSRCRNNNPIKHEAEDTAVRLPFVTTRGCPFNCIFCAANSLSGRKVRFMSAERVISDIKRAKEQYKMTKLVINDDQVLIDKKRIKKILDEISDFNLIVEFPSGLNVKFIDEDIAVRLKRAGLEVANLAVESGSDHVLKKIIDKPLKTADIKPAVDALRKNGLLIHGFFNFGFPDESEDDRIMTIDLIKEIGFDWSNIYVAAPLMGSRLYQIFLENGYIKDEINFLDANIYQSSLRSSEDIGKYVYRVNLDVNFVNNYRMRVGDDQLAEGYFSNVVNNHPRHAFGHYCLSMVYQRLDHDNYRSGKHMREFHEIVATDDEWADHARYFNLI